jgi:hypothetical protein
MQTLDLVVTNSWTAGPWRASRHRKLLVVASLAALALGAAAWLERPAVVSSASLRPKLDARISVAPVEAPSDDDARLAAFQQSVALSFVSKAPAAERDANSHMDVAVLKPLHPRNHALSTVAKRDDPAATPVPPPRPPVPEVIEANLPPAPPADPGYVDASLQALGDVGRRIARVPDRAREFAATAVDGLEGTLSDVRTKIGL